MDMEISKCKRTVNEFSEEKQRRKRMRKRCLEVKKKEKKPRRNSYQNGRLKEEK